MVNSLECEIEGIVLGMELVLEYIYDQSPLTLFSTIHILCDSKSATDSVTMLSSGIRSHNIKNLESLLKQLSVLSVEVKLVNILGHSGLEGNDTADKLSKDVAHQLYRGEITALNNIISRSSAFEVARDISLKSWQRCWDYDHTARYTYSIIPSVQTKVLFPDDRDTGISYLRSVAAITWGSRGQDPSTFWQCGGSTSTWTPPTFYRRAATLNRLWHPGLVV